MLCLVNLWVWSTFGRPSARCVTLVAVGLFWLTMLAGFGIDIARDPLGVLKSSANRYSLARLQMFLWTWVILSAVSAAALCRGFQLTNADLRTAFKIAIHGDLYTVMGVSFFTGAAGPALLALKAQGGADPVQRDLAAARMNEDISALGKIVVRPAGQKAKLSDLVEGDEITSAGVVDLSKVQQLMITVVLVGIYVAMVFDLFGRETFAAFPEGDIKHGAITTLPSLTADMVNLLILSHAGYLGFKAAPKPPAAPEESSTFAGPPPTPDRKAGL